MRDLIHFSHGNGFPALCYFQMLKQLKSKYDYDYFYLQKIGHDTRFPVTDNWPFLVNEVVSNIEKSAEKPVIGLGHSLGGVLTLLAAIQKPSLFKAVIMLDSPLLGRVKSRMVNYAKIVGLIDRITPAFHTLGRRNFWKNKEDIYSYLKKRNLFKEFTPECLDDYIEYGTEKKEKGYSLCFDPQIEYSIYRTIPHNLFKHEGKLTVPTGLIYGKESSVLTQFDVRYMEKKFGIHPIRMQGTHMFPMEHPNETAEEISNMINYLSSKS